MWRVLLIGVAAIIQLGTKMVVSEHICLIGNVNNNGVGSSRWFLPYNDPCVCSAVRLGGSMPHNQPATGHYLDGLFVSEDSGEIQTFFDCPVAPRCGAPDRLGIENNTPLDIPDEYFSASSIDNIGRYQSTPSSARLNFLGGTVSFYSLIGGWKPAVSSGCWIQVKLGRDVIISGVITQGRHNNGFDANWVTHFQVKYATSASDILVGVMTKGGTPKVFVGNIDSDTEVTNSFLVPVLTSTIRLLPVQWHNHVVLRFELLGCLHPVGTSTTLHLATTEPLLYEVGGVEGTNPAYVRDMGAVL